jgi:hypothetical protein
MNFVGLWHVTSLTPQSRRSLKIAALPLLITPHFRRVRWPSRAPDTESPVFPDIID